MTDLARDEQLQDTGRAAPDKATRASDWEVLASARANLATLLLLRARFAATYTLPPTAYAVMAARERIRQLKTGLRAGGYAVADAPDEALSAPMHPYSDWPLSPLRDPLAIPAHDQAARQLVLPGEFAPVSPPQMPELAELPASPVVSEPPYAGDAPAMLHEYLLHERLVDAPHGTLFRASHQPSGRNVFLHLLRGTTDTTAGQIKQALTRPARHAHMLPLIAAGYDAERQAAYVVVPPLRLRTLADVLADGPVSHVQALYLAIQIGEALDALHGSGRAHGHVDATQVLLTPAWDAYLADLGMEAVETGMPGVDKRTRDLVDFAVLLRDTFARGALAATADDSTPVGALEPERIVQLATPASGTLHARDLLTVIDQLFPRPVGQAARDLYASRWEPTAAWLENPLETVLGRYLSTDFLQNSRARAEALHRLGAVGQQLHGPRNSRPQRAPNPPSASPEQIVSYNLYFYELTVHYETRTSLQTTALPLRDGTCPPLRSSYDPWSVPVPYVDPFVDVPRQTLSTTYGGTCPFCEGEIRTVCRACGGDGVFRQVHAHARGDGEHPAIEVEEPCACCGTRGWLACTRCQGIGRVPYELRFVWSRQGRRYWNEDDVGNLQAHTRELERRAQEVFRGRIDLSNAQWHLTAPLRELCEAAVLGGGPDSQPYLAELVIRGVPVTEVDYPDRTRRTYALIGFDNLARLA